MVFCFPQSLLNTTPRGIKSTEPDGTTAEPFQKASPMSDMNKLSGIRSFGACTFLSEPLSSPMPTAALCFDSPPTRTLILTLEPHWAWDQGSQPHTGRSSQRRVAFAVHCFFHSFPAPAVVLFFFSFPTLALHGNVIPRTLPWLILSPCHQSLSHSSCRSRFCLYHNSWAEVRVGFVYIVVRMKKPRAVTWMGLGRGCQSECWASEFSPENLFILPWIESWAKAKPQPQL